jgi:hypothetical protein
MQTFRLVVTCLLAYGHEQGHLVGEESAQSQAMHSQILKQRRIIVTSAIRVAEQALSHGYVEKSRRHVSKVRFIVQWEKKTHNVSKSKGGWKIFYFYIACYVRAVVGVVLTGCWQGVGCDQGCISRN